MMQSRPRQVSPLSLDQGDNTFDSAFIARYEAVGSPYDVAGPRNAQRSPPMQRSPPLSHNGSVHSRSASSALSSAGGGLYSPVMSEGGGRPLTARNEEALLQHYYAFKEFLTGQIDLNAASNPSRARDKLMRLSSTQYYELSTDVFDELRRRQDEQNRRSPDVPRYLMPSREFHPKRNQARQKLATLPGERFRQLATDVYFESERRIPRLGGGMDRSASPALSVGSNYSRGTGRGPPMRGPSNGYNRGPPTPGERPFPTRSSSNDYGRPLPKTSQSNTIVPNVSTMVEDDDTEDEGGMGSMGSDRTNSQGSSITPAQAQVFESQISDLQAKIAELESEVRNKDNVLQKLETSSQEREAEITLERDDWKQVQSELQQKINTLEEATESHAQAMQQSTDAHMQREADLRLEHDQAMSALSSEMTTLNAELSLAKLQGGASSDAADSEWEQRCTKLQQELAEQQRLTDEVRENAMHFLQEMRTLSQQSEAALEKEELLQSQVAALEAEVEEWKGRYAKAKTELRTLKASSIGLPLQNMASDALAARQSFLSRDGLVNDVDVTGFQMSIDALLQTARQDASEPTLEKMKVVIGHVQQMTSGVKHDFTGLPSPAESPNPMTPETNASGRTTATTLKARVARNATALITATRNFVSSDGLSPVSLVDAAAANLTASVIDFVKMVGIKASSSNDLTTPGHEFEDEGYDTLQPTVHVPEPKAVEPKTLMANGWHSRLKGSFDSSYSHDRDDESDYNAYN